MQAEEDRRSGRGSRTFWLWKTIVLAGEGKRSGSVGASALAEEDKCACCGRRACWLWKESGVQKDVRRAGERGNVGWQVR